MDGVPVCAVRGLLQHSVGKYEKNFFFVVKQMGLTPQHNISFTPWIPSPISVRPFAIPTPIECPFQRVGHIWRLLPT